MILATIASHYLGSELAQEGFRHAFQSEVIHRTALTLTVADQHRLKPRDKLLYLDPLVERNVNLPVHGGSFFDWRQANCPHQP
jgi:hypothetical protein